MIDKTKITGGQFLFTVACFLQSSTLLTSLFTSITMQDSWIAVVLGFLACMPLLFFLTRLMKAFPGKNLIQINEIIFGKVLGKVFSAIYLFHFISLGALNLRDLGDFVKKSIMYRTPIIVIIAVFILLCAWALRYGLEAVTRYNALFSFISMLLAVSTSFLVFDLINFENLLPILDLPPISYIHSAHNVAAIPLSEIIVFMMITPNIKLKSKKFTKYFFIGILIGVVNLLIVVLRDTVVLGNTMPYFTIPAFQTLRLIDIARSISRIEIFFATVLIILLYSKIALLYYIIVLALAQIFNIKSYKPLINTVGVILVLYSIVSYRSVFEHAEASMNVEPIIWMITELILPALTYFIMRLRKFKKEGDQDFFDSFDSEHEDEEPEYIRKREQSSSQLPMRQKKSKKTSKGSAQS